MFFWAASMRELNGNEKHCYFLEAGEHSCRRFDAVRLGLSGTVLREFLQRIQLTRLGSVDDPSGLAAALGRGNAEVTFLSVIGDIV